MNETKHAAAMRRAIEDVVSGRLSWDAVPHVIAAYERTVPSDRLMEILAERRVAVHDLVRPQPIRDERYEFRACEVCNEPIEPGEAYTPNGPAHARHAP